jgi:hypothetical protein
MVIFLHILVFVMGAALVALTLSSATRTFVLPRSARDGITNVVFRSSRFLFNLRMRKVSTYNDRDRIMAIYAPVSLLSLLPVWLFMVLAGYTGIFWALGVDAWYDAFKLSGSSLLTLGFSGTNGIDTTIAAFSEAIIGLVLLALLIAYLPTMYAAFSRREQAVNLLEVRAGTPPSAVEMISRYHRIHNLHRLSDVWASWEVWFSDLEETHTSLAALAFFRSPQPDHSWVTAAGAILDAAALSRSTIDIPRDSSTDLCIRAGYLALRRIADYFRIVYNSAPTKDDPISISRQEFDAACDRLAGDGVPLVADRDKAWEDFKGWRVNYDAVLLALAVLTMAPYAPWSSDRSMLVRPGRRGLLKGRSNGK